LAKHGIEATKLWKKIATDPELGAAITSLRRNVESLAPSIKEILPGFTDHSIRHFDHLWKVADRIISDAEFDRMTVSEAFVLGGALYVHDLGMAYGVTIGGRQRLTQSVEYAAAFVRFEEAGRQSPELEAFAEVSRVLHAKQAHEIAINKIPGLDRHLIEQKEIRDIWGAIIGEIAASHHWSIAELKEKLGKRGHQPLGDLGSGDLCYVAALLRVLDFSDMSRERARPFERRMREPLSTLSTAHWDAQENIAGPLREDNYLVFSSLRPIASVEGWWTFYEMASGLDNEILELGEILQTRMCSADRFQLKGVKNVRTPQAFSTLVETAGFEPVDVRFRPDSISRIVYILGGESLYGKDPYAPIRELLQNATDAFSLYRAWAEAEGAQVEVPKIDIRVLDSSEGDRWLEVSDNGIGMTETVITKYLLSIGSSYWKSDDFFRDFAKIDRKKIHPVGKFGIGFLSVFMLGDEIEVTTQRRFGAGFRLKMNGAGHRGALEKLTNMSRPGTTVRIKLKDGGLDGANLAQFMRERAPMIRLPVTLFVRGKETAVQPNWWENLTQHNFIRAVESEVVSGRRRRPSRETADRTFPGELQPEQRNANGRIVASPKHSTVVVCCKGFMVTQIHLPGFLGLINIDDAEVNAARDQLISPSADDLREDWVRRLKDQLVAGIDGLAAEGNIPSSYGFIAKALRYYGRDCIYAANLRWIARLDFLGATHLISLNEATAELKSRKRIIIAYGATPWMAVKNAEIIFATKLLESDATFVLSSAEQSNPGPYDNRTTVGPLESHFSAYGSSLPEVLTFFLEVIGEAIGATEVAARFKWARWNDTLYGIHDPLDFPQRG
jgi:Histidine kinase-, DNA gyrase B-, and HSP90-like ATPase